MITFVVAALIAAVVALLRGGSLKALADTHFNHVWILFIGLGAQLGAEIWTPTWLGGDTGTIVIIGSNLAVVAFLWLNRTHPGLGLVALGLLLNVVVISLNGAMPVSAAAARTSGVPVSSITKDIEHELLDDDTILPWLTDVLAIPRVPGVFSVGDVVLAIGVARLVYLRTTSNKRPRRAARGTAASG